MKIKFSVEAHYDSQNNIEVEVGKLGYTPEQWEEIDEDEREDAIIDYANKNLKRPSYTIISYENA